MNRQEMLDQLRKASEILDRQNVPRYGQRTYMTKQTFLALGGTIETWESIEGDDEAKLIPV